MVVVEGQQPVEGAGVSQLAMRPKADEPAASPSNALTGKQEHCTLPTTAFDPARPWRQQTLTRPSTVQTSSASSSQSRSSGRSASSTPPRPSNASAPPSDPTMERSRPRSPIYPSCGTSSSSTSGTFPSSIGLGRRSFGRTSCKLYAPPAHPVVFAHRLPEICKVLRRLTKAIARSSWNRLRPSRFPRPRIDSRRPSAGSSPSRLIS